MKPPKKKRDIKVLPIQTRILDLKGSLDKCYYCGSNNGIFMVCKEKNHSVIVMCYQCYKMKGNYSEEFFINHIHKIASYFKGDKL